MDDHRLGQGSADQPRGAGGDGSRPGRCAPCSPAELAAALDPSEWLSLRFGAGAGADDEGEWLERLGRLLPARCRAWSAPACAARCRCRRSMPPRCWIADLAIKTAFTACWRTARQTARYYFFNFQYTIESDETSLGSWTACLNASARSLVAQPEALLSAVEDDLEEDPQHLSVPGEELERLFPDGAAGRAAGDPAPGGGHRTERQPPPGAGYRAHRRLLSRSAAADRKATGAARGRSRQRRRRSAAGRPPPNWIAPPNWRTWCASTR